MSNSKFENLFSKKDVIFTNGCEKGGNMNVRKVFIAGLCLLFLAVNSLAFAEDVFVTQNGKKYHASDCRFIKDRETQTIDKQEAVQQGYGPCQKCVSADSAAVQDSTKSTTAPKIAKASKSNKAKNVQEEKDK